MLDYIIKILKNPGRLYNIPSCEIVHNDCFIQEGSV